VGGIKLNLPALVFDAVVVVGANVDVAPKPNIPVLDVAAAVVVDGTPKAKGAEAGVEAENKPEAAVVDGTPKATGFAAGVEAENKPPAVVVDGTPKATGFAAGVEAPNEPAPLLKVNGAAAETGAVLVIGLNCIWDDVVVVVGTPKLDVPGAAVLVGCKPVVVLVVTGACPPEGLGVGLKPPKVNGAASVVVGRAAFVKENAGLGCSPNAGKAEADGAEIGGNPVLKTAAASGFLLRTSITLPVVISG